MLLKLYVRTLVPVLLLAAALYAAPDRALLFGVGNYPPPINSLPGIDKDVNSMRETALFLGFPAEGVHRLMDSQSTLANIHREIETWLIGGGPKGRVLIYFSGHGSLDSLGKPVLVNYDVKFDGRTLGNALVGSELGQWVDQIPSRQVLVVIDSCHSGRTTDAKSATGIVPKFFSYPGMPAPAEDSDISLALSKSVEGRNHIVIAACRREEVAGATREGSILTVALNTAFRQLANSPKGITIDGVRSGLQQLGSGENVQHPEISGNMALAGIDWRAPAASDSKLRQVFDDQLRRAAYPIQLATSKRSYQNNDLMTMTVDVGRPGYLNVVAISEGEAEGVVLFPNKYVSDNHVAAGHISIPNSGAYQIRQHLPEGMNSQQVAVYVLVSDNPVNLYKEGLGSGVFKLLDETKGPEVESAGGKGAGRAEYTIVK